MKRIRSIKTDRHHLLFSPHPPTRTTLFPYTTLFRSKLKVALAQRAEARLTAMELENRLKDLRARLKSDRKKTRLNSSHANISYAALCFINRPPVERSYRVKMARQCGAAHPSMFGVLV